MAYTNAASRPEHRTTVDQKGKSIQYRNRSVIKEIPSRTRFRWNLTTRLRVCVFEICHIIFSRLHVVPVLLLNLFFPKHIRQISRITLFQDSCCFYVDALFKATRARALCEERSILNSTRLPEVNKQSAAPRPRGQMNIRLLMRLDS